MRLLFRAGCERVHEPRFLPGAGARGAILARHRGDARGDPHPPSWHETGLRTRKPPLAAPSRFRRVGVRRRRLTTPARACSLAGDCTARPGVESRRAVSARARVRKWRSVPLHGAKTGLRTPKAVAGRAPSRVSAGRAVRRRHERVRKWRFVSLPGTNPGLRTRKSAFSHNAARVSPGHAIRHLRGRVRKWRSVPRPGMNTGLRTRGCGTR